MFRTEYLKGKNITNDAEVLKIFAAVKKYGGVVRFVGGAVRDTLAGLPANGLNLCTDLSPDELAEACEEAGLKTMPIGLKIGSLGVAAGSNVIEVSSLKIRNPKDELEFTDNWEADAAGRDLTINAVYADEEGNVFDYYNGIKDLEQGIVRFIGDTDKNIAADSERILRFFRFYSLFGRGEIDAKVLKACREHSNELKKVPVETIWRELKNILVTPNAAKVLQIMFANNVLSNLLSDDADLAALTRLIDCERRAGVAPDALRRLFAMYHPDKALAENFAIRWHFSKKEKEKIIACCEMPNRAEDFTGAALLPQVYRHGNELCLDKYLICCSRGESPDIADKVRDIINTKVPVLPIDGKDIIALGIADNNKIGYWIERLEAAWVASNFTLNRDQLLALVA